MPTPRRTSRRWPPGSRRAGERRRRPGCAGDFFDSFRSGPAIVCSRSVAAPAWSFATWPRSSAGAARSWASTRAGSSWPARVSSVARPRAGPALRCASPTARSCRSPPIDSTPRSPSRSFSTSPTRSAVVREMARVTRPGGRLALQDQDFGVVALTHPDRALTDRIMQGVAEHVYPEPHSGRRLPGLLRRRGSRGRAPADRRLPGHHARAVDQDVPRAPRRARRALRHRRRVDRPAVARRLHRGRRPGRVRPHAELLRRRRE